MDMTTAKPFACKSDGCGMSFTNEDHLTVHEKKHEMMLNLSLGGQKSGNIFVADQTPTPTRLIKNCEEVGLFDDLRHVNPFDETFRRAVEQKTCHTPNSQVDSLVEADRDPAEDSLHTPQVYPQIDANDGIEFRRCELLQKVPESLEVPNDDPNCELSITDSVPNDMGKTFTSRQNSSSTTMNWGYGKLQRYRSIAEKPSENLERAVNLPSNVQLPVSIQLIQPQVITLTFPNSNVNRVSSAAATAIPVQTVKPFILPKQTTPSSTVTNSMDENSNHAVTTTATTASAPIATQPEPSSASLTPTSQLPIKERLKVILSNSSKSRIIELPQKTSIRRTGNSSIAVNAASKCGDDFMERRRAASTRYRIKMRSVHEDLRRRNQELQTENEKLKQRVKNLESELVTQKNITSMQTTETSYHPQIECVPTQIQIPPSTLHLVMNIPKLIIPPTGQPIMTNPITLKVEKK